MMMVMVDVAFDFVLWEKREKTRVSATRILAHARWRCIIILCVDADVVCMIIVFIVYHHMLYYGAGARTRSNKKTSDPSAKILNAEIGPG